jgi:hypothetical protein
MNASDIIRKRNTMTQWVNYSTITLAGQANCTVGCSNNLSPNCTTNFKSYEQRIILAEGRRDTSTCADPFVCLPTN